MKRTFLKTKNDLRSIIKPHISTFLRQAVHEECCSSLLWTTEKALIRTPIFLHTRLQPGAQRSANRLSKDSSLPYKDTDTNPKVENVWHLVAQGWSVKESRLWSPDRSCLRYSGLCLYGVETGAGTSSCRGAWCPPPAAWDGPRQATGARVSSWGPAEGAGSSHFSDRTSSAGCWSWAWSHRWEESVNRRDEIFSFIVEWMLGPTCNVFLFSDNLYKLFPTSSPSFTKSFLHMCAMIPVARASPITFTIVLNRSLIYSKPHINKAQSEILININHRCYKICSFPTQLDYLYTVAAGVPPGLWFWVG